MECGKASTYIVWCMKMEEFMTVKGVGEAIKEDFDFAMSKVKRTDDKQN